MSFSLFSLNLWNLNQDVRGRMRRLDTYLSAARPTLACFQEVSPLEPGGRPQSDLICTQMPEMTRLYSSQTQWNEREEGLAMLSSLPLISFDSFMLPEAPKDQQRRLQIAVFRYRGKKIIVANTHLAFREDQDNFRLIQVEIILKHLASSAKHHETSAIILVGDFNSTPNSLPIAKVLDDQLQLRDPFAKTDLRRFGHTFAAESPYADVTATNRWIDYVFVTDCFEIQSLELSLNGSLSGDYVSDHAALEITFELSGRSNSKK